MRVARCNDGLARLLSELDYSAVYAAQIVLARHHTLVDEIAVIRERHYLEVVEKVTNLEQLRLGALRQNGAVQNSVRASRADDKSVAVLLEHRLRNARVLGIVIEISLGDKTVQIFQSHLIAHENGHMIRAQLARVNVVAHRPLH